MIKIISKLGTGIFQPNKGIKKQLEITSHSMAKDWIHSPQRSGIRHGCPQVLNAFQHFTEGYT